MDGNIASVYAARMHNI